MTMAMTYPAFGFDIFTASTPSSRAGIEGSPLEPTALARQQLASEQARHDRIDSLIALDRRYQEPNWDGEGASPIPEAAIHEARMFLYRFPASLPLPDVTAEPDGYLGLEWYGHKRLLFGVSLNGKGALSCSGLIGQTKIYGTYYMDDGIPGEILREIARIV